MLQIYKASAGSGKTYNLAKQYLKLILGRRDEATQKWQLRKPPYRAHRNILAITFTNKATQEMIRRIIDELAVLGGIHPDFPDKESDYLASFIKEFGASAEEIRKAAGEALYDLLFDFGFFHVSTIDAFFQVVLRTFAREIELPDNFGLEIDNKFTISLGMSEMFNSINNRDSADENVRKERRWLKNWLQRYMERLLSEGKAINLFSRTSSGYTSMIDSFTSLLNEDFKINSREILDYLSDKSRLERFEKELRSRVDTLKKELESLSSEVVACGDFENLNRHVKARIRAWSDGEFSTKKLPATLIKAVDEQKSRYVADYLKKGPDATFDSLVGEVCRVAVSYYKMQPMVTVCVTAVTTLGLLACLLQFVEEYCKDNNIIMLSDTNSLLREIINTDDTPFVYERLGYYLRHFLIDEFQDTSKMQWSNLAPLLKESLGWGHDNLVIGDEKQCIYRFRNSDPELLGNNVEKEITTYSGNDSVTVKGVSVRDNYNWRSAPEVVRFNNTIFMALAQVIDELNGFTGSPTPSSARHTYSSVVQGIDASRLDKQGYVKLIIQKKQEKASEEEDLEEESRDSSSFAVETTISEVKRMHGAGYRPKDIAVLVRTHSEGEKIINGLLDEMNRPDSDMPHVEIVSTDAMNISSSSAVRVVIGILRTAVLPVVVKAGRPGQKTRTVINPSWRLARLQQRFESYLNDKEMPAEENRFSYALSRAIEEGKDESADLEDLETYGRPNIGADKERQRQTLESATLDTVVDRIIDRYIDPAVYESENIFLTAFHDLVYDFTQRGTADINSFLQWWDNGGRRSGLTSSADVDAINVMTIHQSKGLEFPCVIVPFANWDMVSYSSVMRKSYDWYRIDKTMLPDIDKEIIPPFMPVDNSSALDKIELFSRQSKELASKRRVDALNVTYVAFTRAVDELVIITTDDNRKDYLGNALMKSLSLLATDGFVEKDSELEPWLVRPKIEVDGELLTVGVPTTAKVKSDKNDVAKSDPLTEKIARAYTPGVNENLMILSKADYDTFDFRDPRHRGKFLHSIMSRVKRKSELDLAIRRAANRANLTPEQMDDCYDILIRALGNPRAAGWFEGNIRVYNEYTLTEKVEDKADDRRPDRIVVYPDGSVDVIDYKFGEHKNSYYNQVRRYMNRMKRAGYETVRGYLWYPLDDRILEVIPSSESIRFSKENVNNK